MTNVGPTPTRPIAAAITIGMLAVAIAIYLRPSQNRYAFERSRGQIQRFDRQSGEMMFCQDGDCFTVDHDGRYHPVASRKSDEEALLAQEEASNGAPTLDEAEAIWNGIQERKRRVAEAEATYSSPIVKSIRSGK